MTTGNNTKSTKDQKTASAASFSGATEKRIEHQELDLARPQDFGLFMENVTAVYTEAAAVRNEVRLALSMSLAGDDILSEEVFAVMQHKFEVLQKYAVDCQQGIAGDAVISDEKIDIIQKLYDDVLFLADYILGYQEKEVVESLVDSDTVGLDDLLIVLNVEMPSSGVTGLSSARKLRESLLVARDEDPVFIHDTKKQIVADRLIRKLANISAAGLSEDDVQDITIAIQMIGVELLKNEEVSEVEVVESLSDLSLDIAEDFTDPLVSRGSLFVKREDDFEEVVPIKVTQQVKKTTKLGAKKTGNKPQINNSLLRDTEPIFEKNKQQTPLVNSYLSQAFYLDFVDEYYDSKMVFERILNVAITRIEEHTLDVFERWLGEKFSSPFKFIKDMKVADVLAMSEQTAVREIIAGENIKYETFVTWVDLIVEMQSMVSDHQDMLFGELFICWVIESEIEYIEYLTKNNTQVS